MKLNLGCGSQKIKGYINIDAEKSVKPDRVFDFIAKPLPYKDGTVTEIVLFHTIEHIQKKYHPAVVGEIARLLKSGGKVYISYPDFWDCANLWKSNFQGKRTFWHATLFGLQLYKHDFHVCAMDPAELEQLLRDAGFNKVKTVAEKFDKFNRITTATKGKKKLISYEQQVGQDNRSHHLVKR